MPHPTHSLPARALALLLALALALPAPWSAAPARAGMFSFDLKDEKELGEKFNVLIRSKLPMVEDSEVVDYAREVVERITRQMPPQPFPFTVAVVRDNAVNAFAAPAGYVFVFTGLILSMDHESEVAGVLAHELAHVTQRHIAKRVEQSSMIGIASMLGVLAGFALGAATGQKDAAGAMMVGSQAAARQALLNYSRDDEREADEVGMNYLVNANYPPRGLPQAFEVMQRTKIFKGYGSVPAYLSTHPEINERVGYLSERVARLPKNVVSRPDRDERFLRVQTVIRARYQDPGTAIAWFSRKGASMTKLDRLGLAMALGRTTENAKAREAFEAALKEGGDDSLWLREAGRFYLRLRDFQRAGSLLKRAVEQNPRDMVAVEGYALFQAQEGKRVEAMQLMRRVVAYAPDSPEVRQQMARIYGEVGDLFQAHLNLAYSAVYANDPRQTRMQMEKAKERIRTEDDRKEYAKLEKVYRDRSEYWPKQAM
ncbi:Beta-barrel assembly-enhancing protease [Fundidesulfovibrio magnetotacticus]|uniref:Beta-barrel assembly-enhancing protease n=1 Tax=Fundidesulfovibrio magnetotacticus TaxID=2730080 RepID=A0A6V8LUN0_9BACT|nr:M48 family metallopeptidase [Fundidesulfovibrio magnetotacticus]GFK93357.1 Beta-barrel assembly-enhancing protease [Fundidesulfovibrio magnetotacticus]